MKKFFIFVFISINVTSLFSQTNWKINGNTVVSGDWIGTLNTEPLIFRTDNTVRFRINANGNIIFKEFDGIGSTGLFGYNANGRLVGIAYTGNPNDVFKGDGSFGAISNAAGWLLVPGGISFTYNKVGIGGIAMPVEALEVNGNAIFNGSVSATEFKAGDVQGQGRSLRIISGLCLKGYDASVDGSRSEICGMGNDLFLQSNAFDKHTILNYSNNGLVGIGTNNPLAKLHVEGSFRVDGETQFTSNSRFHRILPLVGDTVVYFGDSSVAWASNNRMYWTPAFVSVLSPTVKGFGIGNGFVQAIGLNSIAMGFASNCNATHSLVLGKWLGNPSGESRFVIGTGVGTSAPQRLVNNAVDNSLVVGFNSNIPTFYVGPSAGMNTTGNVGIATTTPEDKLQIKTESFHKFTIGNARFETLHFGTQYLGFNAVRTAAGTWKTETDGQHNGGAIIYSSVLGNMYFATIGDINDDGFPGDHTGITDAEVDSKTHLFIDGKTGNVGIGTMCQPYAFPYKLAVNGKIICEEVKVKISDASGCWPDYVFAKNYNLMPLKTLETYIDTNSHLPGFKPAAEMEEEGINMAETLKLQQQKIEELTLYIIELSKKIEKLEAK